jgi:hypothetical protein
MGTDFATKTALLKAACLDVEPDYTLVCCDGQEPT